MQIGDRVEISQIVKQEIGWNNLWIEGMDVLVGEVGVIERIDETGVYLQGIAFGFPPSSLRVILPVAPPKIKHVKSNKVSIEGQVLIEEKELEYLRKEATILELLRENGLEDWPFYQESLKSL